MTPRWWIAWHPDCPAAFLRWKHDAALAEWRSRAWEAFNGPPTIVEVTHLFEAWRAVTPRSPTFCVEHAALGHAGCDDLKWVDSDLTVGAFCWVVPAGGLRCRAFAGTEGEERDHTNLSGHDDWLVLLPHAEPFPNPGPRVRKIGAHGGRGGS